MAVYQVTTPGGVFEVNTPEGASEADAIAYAKRQGLGQQSGPDNLGTDEAQRGVIGGDRSVMDQLLGVNGPRHQTYPERLVRGLGSAIYSGATLPGDVTSQAMQDTANPPKQISDSDVSPLGVGRALDAASLGAGPSIRTGTSMRNASDVKAAAVRGYNSPEVTSLRLAPSGPARLANEITANIEGKGAREYFPEMGSGIYKPLDELRGLPNASSAPKGSYQPQTILSGPGYHIADDIFKPAPATIQDITGVRTALGNTVQQGIDPLTGAMSPASGRAAQAQGDITKYLNNIPASDVVAGNAPAAAARLSNAGADYAASQKMGILDALARRAELKKGTANSGSNMNTERQEVKNFILNQRDASGLKPAEEAAAERVVMGTRTGNTARSLANSLDPRGGMSGLSMAGAGSVGGAVGHVLGFDPATSALVAALGGKTIGKIARGVANSSEERTFNNFRQIVLEGSPSARASISNDKSQAMNAALAKALLYGTQPGSGNF